MQRPPRSWRFMPIRRRRLFGPTNGLEHSAQSNRWPTASRSQEFGSYLALAACAKIELRYAKSALAGRQGPTGFQRSGMCSGFRHGPHDKLNSTRHWGFIACPPRAMSLGVAEVPPDVRSQGLPLLGVHRIPYHLSSGAVTCSASRLRLIETPEVE